MKKLILILLALFLITACTPEDTTDWTTGTQEDTSDTGTAGLDTEEQQDTGRYSLDDFQYGAEKIVYYTGTASESQTLISSSYTEYFINEEDSSYSQDYNFEVVRVYYGDMSLLYLTSLDGSVSLNYQKSTEEIFSGEMITEEINNGASATENPDTPRKVGQIDADGEVYFSIIGATSNFHNTCTKTITYSDGTSKTYDSSSCAFSGLNIGGGSDEQCQPSAADMALSNAGSCNYTLPAMEALQEASQIQYMTPMKIVIQHKLGQLPGH